MIQLSNRNVFILFLALGLFLYGNTLGHDFALDDAIAITDNNFTKKGISGIWDQLSNDSFVGFFGEQKKLVSGGRYRPLSFVLFNLQYALFGENAFVGHLVNILFYVLNGFLLFLVLSKLLKNYPSIHRLLPFSLLVSLLWFFHPIHTEAVANIKGLDEILAFCLELLSFLLTLSYLKTKKIKYLAYTFITFFLALLAKESAITWLAVIPLGVYFFTPHKLKETAIAFSALAVASLSWYVIRHAVIGDGISDVADNLMNNPFLKSSISDKYATIVLTLGKYIQLLFFPHPLTYDYYPKHIPIVTWGNPFVILSVFLYLSLAFIAVKGFFKKNLSSFAILFFVITLSIVSNLFFPIGTFMNERFVYVSSLAFALILAQFLASGLSKISQKIPLALLLVILVLYSAKTISRNSVWKNDFTLAINDANISVNGAKSNVTAGGKLIEKADLATNPAEKERLLKEAIFYLNRSVSALPDYTDALNLMGNAQWKLTADINRAMPYYLKVIAVSPTHTNAWSNSLIILEQSKNVDSKIKYYQTLLRYNPNKVDLYLRLGRAYGREKNELNNAQAYLEKGLQIAPNNYDLLSNLGTLYGLQKNYTAAITVLEKTKTIRPNVTKTYIELGLSYFYIGEQEKAKQAFDKAKQLDNSINRSQFPI